jgi:putative FmdB family regulatory protein
MGMNIHSEPGSLVRFAHPNNGYKSESDLAKKHLTLNEIYTVQYTVVHNWSTDVRLLEVPDITFNSVCFEDYEDQMLPYDFDLLWDIKTVRELERELFSIAMRHESMLDSIEGHEMAVYEYECTECKHKFIKIFKISEKDTPVECPQCEAPAEMQVSSSTFQLKGSGWTEKGF